MLLDDGERQWTLSFDTPANEHDVPLVENPPLARALHATVEIDDEIPPEHYKAVAAAIIFADKLRAEQRERDSLYSRAEH